MDEPVVELHRDPPQALVSQRLARPGQKSFESQDGRLGRLPGTRTVLVCDEPAQRPARGFRIVSAGYISQGSQSRRLDQSTFSGSKEHGSPPG